MSITIVFITEAVWIRVIYSPISKRRMNEELNRLERGRKNKLIDSLSAQLQKFENKPKSCEDSLRYDCDCRIVFCSIDIMRKNKLPSVEDVCGAGFDMMKRSRISENGFFEHAPKAEIAFPHFPVGLRTSGLQKFEEKLPVRAYRYKDSRQKI